jgi:hypothetical protein
MATSNRSEIKFAAFQIKVSTAALVLMLAAILLPAVNNSMRQQSHTPSQLLITICVSLFASVVYLWILDATNILPFREKWISRSIYGAAIASVLGTSVGVYKDYFQVDKYPLRGKWMLTMVDSTHFNAENDLVLEYSLTSKVYYGFTNINYAALKDTSRSVFIGAEVLGLSTEDETIRVTFFKKGGDKTAIMSNFSINKEGTLLRVDTGGKSIITMARPNN